MAVLDELICIPHHAPQSPILWIEAIAEQLERLAPDDAPGMQAFGPSQQIACARERDARDRHERGIRFAVGIERTCESWLFRRHIESCTLHAAGLEDHLLDILV